MILKIIFLILLVKYSSSKDNVGTVLFTESDNLRRCWSNEEIALLTSRMIFQDVLPEKNVLNIQNDHFITSLISYFRMVVETVRKMTTGKTKHVMLLALSDVLGGYLHHTALPLSKFAFYTGNVNYESVEKLHELYEELKTFLRTDGKSWAKPITDFTSFKFDAKPLPMMTNDEKNVPCTGLVHYEIKVTDGNQSEIFIPMPFLDSKREPHSIAVPFKSYSLRSIQSKNAAFVLVKFYLSATKCLIAKDVSEKNIQKFNDEYERFLEKDILPHLNDGKFYAAFGSVYRIIETLSRFKGNEKNKNRIMGNYGVMPSQKPKSQAANAKTTNDFEPLVSTAEPGDEDRSVSIMFIALACVILIWICTGCLYCCCMLRRKKKKQDAEALSIKSRRSEKSDANEPCHAKSKPASPGQKCKKCKRSNCHHVHMLYDMSSPGISSKKSEQISKKEPTQEKSRHISGQNLNIAIPVYDTSTKTTNSEVEMGEKPPIVFGYDFETSSSESSPREGSSRSNTHRSPP